MRVSAHPSARLIGLGLLMLAAIALTAALKPMPQPLAYHQFADARQMVGIPRAFDVLSNLPFVLVGVAGFYLCLRRRHELWCSGVLSAYSTLFAGLILTGIGSGFYHLSPDNQRLVWDRLPMTLVMAGFAALLIMDRVQRRISWLVPALALTGAGTVLQWWWSESTGHGDVRWYLLFQALIFGSGLYLMLLFPAIKLEPTRAIAIAIAANIAAKIFELLDRTIYSYGGIVSGHTLKHLSAGLGFVPIVFWLAAQRRHDLNAPEVDFKDNSHEKLKEDLIPDGKC